MELFLKGLGIVITILIVAGFVFLLDYLNALGLRPPVFRLVCRS